MVILRYKEWLTINPKESMWVYDVCPEMPEWDAKKQDYVCTKAKRISPREAKELIQKHGLVCVISNEYGKIYA